MSKNSAEQVENNINKFNSLKLTKISNAIKEKSSGQFNGVFIRALDSYVTFGLYAWIKDLDAQMLGLSKISVGDQSRINQLKGFISNTAKVDANWKNIRRLATLTGK